jgi:hypothetical protein
MWQSDTDRQKATHHERHIQSVTRVMLPMMDVASLVERTPESERRRAAEHARLAWPMAGHEVDMAERSPAVMTHLVAWVEAHVVGLFRQRESSEAAGRR